MRKICSGELPLQIPNGKLRGIVVRDVFRRLVGWTLMKQFAPETQAATHPTRDRRWRSRCASVDDPNTTILSIDRVGTHDPIPRKSMFGLFLTEMLSLNPSLYF